MPYSTVQGHRRASIRASKRADDGRTVLVGELVGGVAVVLPMATSMMTTGAYAIPQVHVRTRAVVTNTAPTAPYRGAGRPEAASAIERTVDLIACRLDLDPAEVRRRDFIALDAFPYDTPTGFTYDSGDYVKALDVALHELDYAGWRAEQARRVTTGEPPIGIGLCTYVERSGAGEEFGAVEACTDGSFVALSGGCSTGQGHETSFFAGRRGEGVGERALYRWWRVVAADRLCRLLRGIRGRYIGRSAMPGDRDALIRSTASGLADRPGRGTPVSESRPTSGRQRHEPVMQHAMNHSPAGVIITPRAHHAARRPGVQTGASLVVVLEHPLSANPRLAGRRCEGYRILPGPSGRRPVCLQSER